MKGRGPGDRHEKRIVSSRKTMQGYGGQSLEELLALEETYTTDSLMRTIELALTQKFMKRGLASLSWAERALVAAAAFERACSVGGGFLEFFQCDPHFASELATAYEKLECPLRAKTAKRAYDCLGLEGEPTPGDVRRALIEGGYDLTVVLERWDMDSFDGEDLEERQFAFCHRNKDWIRLR